MAGMLIDGVWDNDAEVPHDARGAFVRDALAWSKYSAAVATG